MFAFLLGEIIHVLGDVSLVQTAVTLSIALVAAVSGMAVGWRRLTVLGGAEREKLQAEKTDIIQTAEDRATARAIEALKLALEIVERERDRAHRDLGAAREEIVELRARVVKLEAVIDRRKKQHHPHPGRRVGDRKEKS